MVDPKSQEHRNKLTACGSRLSRVDVADDDHVNMCLFFTDAIC